MIKIFHAQNRGGLDYPIPDWWYDSESENLKLDTTTSPGTSYVEIMYDKVGNNHAYTDFGPDQEGWPRIENGYAFNNQAIVVNRKYRIGFGASKLNMGSPIVLPTDFTIFFVAWILQDDYIRYQTIISGYNGSSHSGRMFAQADAAPDEIGMQGAITNLLADPAATGNKGGGTWPVIFAYKKNKIYGYKLSTSNFGEYSTYVIQDTINDFNEMKYMFRGNLNWDRDYFNGDFYEMMYYGRDLSDDDMNKVFAYLNNRYS